VQNKKSEGEGEECRTCFSYLGQHQKCSRYADKAVTPAQAACRIYEALNLQEVSGMEVRPKKDWLDFPTKEVHQVSAKRVDPDKRTWIQVEGQKDPYRWFNLEYFDIVGGD